MYRPFFLQNLCKNDIFHVDDVTMGDTVKLFQYHRGRNIQKRWVFGMAVMGHNPPRPLFTLIKRRDRLTLEGVIRRQVTPGTTVISDEWPAYNALAAIGYDHRTVNHSVNYVNPLNGKKGSLTNSHLICVIISSHHHLVPAPSASKEIWYSITLFCNYRPLILTCTQ